jgi:ubiquinone/menaquinone biosynthesis C-methylase UbiE
MSALPRNDPTFIFEYARSIHATELLAAAVAHFNLFDHLRDGPRSADDLRRRLGLAERPFSVLTTALQAMGLLVRSTDGAFDLTASAREHLLQGEPFDISDYIGLAAKNPSVLAMVERLRTNKPFGAEPSSSAHQGTAFIFREGTASAMDQTDSARSLTLSLAGRARNVAPYLAERVPLSSQARTLLDVGGGTGIYAYAVLRRQPHWRAIILDRAEVLKTAKECADEFGVRDRVEFLAGDMFECSYPAADVVLFSNILHDWDVPECERLLRRAAESRRPGGEVWIHDVYLNDALDGPLPVALYSAALFALTEGRAYSAAEYRAWMTKAGLRPAAQIIPTLVHCGLLKGS